MSPARTQDQLRDSVLMSLFIAAGYIGQSISSPQTTAGHHRCHRK